MAFNHWVVIQKWLTATIGLALFYKGKHKKGEIHFFSKKVLTQCFINDILFVLSTKSVNNLHIILNVEKCLKKCCKSIDLIEGI
jgi:hypothetical protein